MTRALDETVDGTPVARRHFIKWLLGFSAITTAAGVLVPVIGYLWPPESDAAGYAGPTEVGSVDDFPVNSGKVVPVANKPVIVVNTQAGGLKAFSAICTHLGCIVYWHSQRQSIVSPCHDGIFSPANGNVISGPPPRPLPPYELAVKDGKVYVGQPLGKLYEA